MKRKLPYLLPSIVFFLGAPVVWILCFREVPLRISPETTYITEPKTADGKSIDYFRAIKDRFEPKCKPEENGFRMIVAALGKSPYFDEPDWSWSEYCKELDLDPNLTPTLKYEDPYEFLKREYLLWLDENDAFINGEDTKEKSNESTDTEKLHSRLQTAPWNEQEFPFMARWVEENSPMLDLVAEALKKKYFFRPGIQDPERKGTVDPEAIFTAGHDCLPSFRDGFRYRMQYRLGKNDLDAAWDDAMNIARLFIVPRPNFQPGPRYNDALRVVRVGEPTTEQRKKFLADLDSLPESESLDDFLEYSRLRTLYEIAGHSESSIPSVSGYINWNVVAHQTNRYFDGPFREIAAMDQAASWIFFNRLKPKRFWLSRLLEKPLTVDERSAELAWLYCAWLLPGGDSSNSKTLAELRTLLEDEK